MKNQDPTNPLKSHEMAAQLAQFSGLEQMQNMNTTLTEMLKAQKPNESFQALNFIGKSVAGDSAKIVRMKGDKEHEFTYILPDDAKEAELKIRNAEGEIIRKVSFHDLKKGDNKWMWNGKADSGATAPVGDYQFILEAKASNGNKLAVKTDFDGMISGISYTNEGPVLMVGTQAVKMKDVKKIEDPSLKNNGQKTAAPKAPDLKSLSAAPQTEDKGAEEAAVVPSNIMTGVGLSGGMMEKLKKETTPGPVSKPESKHETKKSEPTASERAQASKKPSQRAGNG